MINSGKLRKIEDCPSFSDLWQLTVQTFVTRVAKRVVPWCFRNLPSNGVRLVVHCQKKVVTRFLQGLHFDWPIKVAITNVCNSIINPLVLKSAKMNLKFHFVKVFPKRFRLKGHTKWHRISSTD